MASCTESALRRNRLKLHPGPDLLAVTPCCCDIAFSREWLPVTVATRRPGGLTRHRGRKEQRLSLANVCRSVGSPGGDVQRKEGEGWAGAREGLGALRSGATCHNSSTQEVCPAPPTGSLLSCQSERLDWLGSYGFLCKGPFLSPVLVSLPCSHQQSHS